MICESRPFTQIDRTYKIQSKELKDKLGITGRIMAIGLESGLSPDEENKGKSHDNDIWYISTEEKHKG